MNSFLKSFCCIGVSALLIIAAGCSNPIFKKFGDGNNAAQMTSLNWEQSYESAMEMARQTGKPVLANFTGSDWCHWCKKLHHDVFDQPEFSDWAADHVVLLELDFPQNSSQNPAIKDQNQALANQFGINSYPTVLLISPEGGELGRLGYVAGGPGNWIESAEQQMGNTAQ